MGIREERLARAATMPHRRQAQEESIDARLESTIGQFCFKGYISEAEFDAGVRYGKIVINYLQSIDAPLPYGSGFSDVSDDGCFLRKIIFSQARQILKDAAEDSKLRQTTVINAVDRLTVYGESPRNDHEMKALGVGLRALARGSNVIPISRTARP